MGDSTAIAHFDAYDQPLDNTAFAFALNALIKARALTITVVGTSGTVRLGSVPPPPVTPAVLEDSRILAAIARLTPALDFARTAVVQKICPKKLENNLVAF
jgi:hypothetical protein